MCPPAASPLPDIDISSTYEELFGSLEKMNKGYPLPSNVINDVDPYNHMPSNLPDGLWFLVSCKDNKSVQHGHWKAKGEACEIFSNSLITGWRTTLEFYDGQDPHGCKTDWVMQEYRITQKKWCKSKKAEDVSSLCRVFLIDRSGPTHEKKQKMAAVSAADINGGTHIDPAELSSARVNHDRDQGSTSKHQVLQVNNDNDETKEMPAMENHLSRDDYLELLDLVDPLSPSSSSENSSCLTMSSDEYFDSWALLQELETKNNNGIAAKNAGYKYSFPTSQKSNEVVMLPESLVSLERSKSTGKEIFKCGSSTPYSATANRNLEQLGEKQVIRVEKADYKDEGPSNPQYPAISSDRNLAIPKGGRKPTNGRIKKLKKNYFRFMPF
ncbi:NAC domain-containing protein 76-like isoform X3 [Mangifera indica]|nr:NAC domain-containing protein 76-like isoform X3 [Mangifera indica]XP_044511563.1 NAC domain-containing protein 76-like isoform X3 [Mangifera indica]